MTEYIEVSDAVTRPGLRLVLTAGFPGPWGEAAKGLFHVKRIPFARVRQAAGAPNEALRAWTGRRNAPIAVYADEEPRDGWAEILALAERLQPEPSLVPRDPEDRARMFGLAHLICGEGGFGWQRRLHIIQATYDSLRDAPAATRAGAEVLAHQYGYTPEAALAAPRHSAEILSLLSEQLEAQRGAGRRYLVGETLSALDIYWATFAALFEPLPEAACPLGPMRAFYTCSDADVRKAASPALIEHRQYVYETHLELPLSF